VQARRAAWRARWGGGAVVGAVLLLWAAHAALGARRTSGLLGLLHVYTTSASLATYRARSTANSLT
jgi:hypothetical protein